MDAKKGHGATCIGLLASACGFLAAMSLYVCFVLGVGCGVRRSADPVCDQLEIQKWPSHLSHRRASDFSARLFRQSVANVNEETKYEYLKDTGMDLARPWPKGLKMESGLGSAMFGISGVNFFPFPGVQNNGFAYKLDLDQTCITSGERLEFGCPLGDFRTRALSSSSTGEASECRRVRVWLTGGCWPFGVAA